MKVAEFSVEGDTGEVHVTDDGTVRLELPGHWLVQSVFPGSGGNDKMNVNLIPSQEEA